MILAFLLLQAAAPDPAALAAPSAVTAPARGAAAPADDAAEKNAPIDNLHQEVVDAIRNCPHDKSGEVVVCARDRGVAEGYRIPKLDPRFAGNNLRKSGRGTVDAANGAVGGSGTGSCSNIGASGATGCSLREAKAWGEWKKQQKADGREFPW